MSARRDLSFSKGGSAKHAAQDLKVVDDGFHELVVREQKKTCLSCTPDLEDARHSLATLGFIVAGSHEGMQIGLLLDVDGKMVDLNHWIFVVSSRAAFEARCPPQEENSVLDCQMGGEPAKSLWLFGMTLALSATTPLIRAQLPDTVTDSSTHCVVLVASSRSHFAKRAIYAALTNARHMCDACLACGQSDIPTGWLPEWPAIVSNNN